MRWNSVLRYFLSSGVSFLISFGGPILLHEAFGVEPSLGVALCLFATFFFNFFTTKYFVYQSSGPIGREFAGYAGLNASFRIAEYLSFTLLYVIFGMPYYVANLLVLVSSFALKFFAFEYLYSRKRGALPS